MANVLSEDFEGGTAGAAITTGNSGVGNVYGPVVFSAGAIEGTLCARYPAVGVQTATQFDHAAIDGVGWMSAYFYAEELPAANTYIGIWSDVGSANGVADFRLEPDGKIVVRNGFSAAVTSPAIITAGAWHRLALRITRNTQMELRLYIGANRHGTVPDWSGTAASTKDFPLGRFICGVAVAATANVRFDRIRIDNASEPESMAPSTPLPAPVVSVTGTDPSAPAATDGQAAATWTGGPGTFESCILPGSVTTGASSTRSSTATNRTFTGLAAGTYTVAVRRTV